MRIPSATSKNASSISCQQDPATLASRIYAQVSASNLQAAVTTVGELTRPPDDNYAQELLDRHHMMRRFLPTFWRTLEFESTLGGRPTLQAVQFLQQIEGRPRASMQAAPREVIPRSWQRYVLPRSARGTNGPQEPQVNSQAYAVCVVERLHEALRRHDVFVDPSEGRGVTYLNYTSDQFTGLGGLVIPGTIRDSVYVLEALLEQESGLNPTEIMSDTASYTVM